jgi:hypothetical protein
MRMQREPFELTRHSTRLRGAQLRPKRHKRLSAGSIGAGPQIKTRAGICQQEITDASAIRTGTEEARRRAVMRKLSQRSASVFYLRSANPSCLVLLVTF